jgi:hypothetical protein
LKPIRSAINWIAQFKFFGITISLNNQWLWNSYFHIYETKIVDTHTAVSCFLTVETLAEWKQTQIKRAHFFDMKRILVSSSSRR